MRPESSNRFRTAQAADAVKVAAFVNSAYRGDSSKAGWTTEADILGGQRVDAEKILEMISESDVRVELLESDMRELLGSVYLRHESTRTCYLGMLTVSPSQQARGLGKKILLHSESVGREWGCTEMRITVIPRRTELVAFYERRGYVKTGKFEAFPDADPRFGIPKVSGLRLDEWVKAL